MTDKSEKIAYLETQIAAAKAERNRACKKLKKLRQKLNQAKREAEQALKERGQK